MIRTGPRPALASPPIARPMVGRLAARPGVAARVVTIALAGLLLFGLALVPRAADLDRHMTVDEDLTLGRTGNFAEGLAIGRPRRTFQIGHPEVTVMWVAALSMGPARARELAGSVYFDGRVSTERAAADRPGFMDKLARARLGLAVVHAALLAGAALLVWRLAGPAAGLLAGAILALEPFLVAHGRIVRADALVSELMLLAILAATAYWMRGAGRWALALASAATGLALLTKTPAAALLPVIVAIALAARRRRAALVPWLAGAAVVYVACWPAMWVAPLETIGRVIDYTADAGGNPMESGTFLLGSPAPNGGPLFYPVVLLLRLSPVVLLGLAILAARRGGRSRGLAAVILLCALAILLELTAAAKRADRYVLPMVPLLAIAAGLGVAELARSRRAVGLQLGLGAVALGQLAILLPVWPYPLAYYNPLLGGGSAAVRAMPVGWGEGLDLVAAELNRLPDATKSTAAVFYPDTLAAQFDGRAVPLEAYDVADYAVLYVAADQRNLTPAPLAAYLADRTPLVEVDLNGVRYARLYRLPAPELAGGLRLDDVQIDGPTTLERGGGARLALRWTAAAPGLAGFRTRLALLGSDGRVLAESTGPSRAAPAVGEVLEERLRIRTPDRLGRYTVALSVLADSGGPLPVTQRPPGLGEQPTRLDFRSLGVRVAENP